MLADVLARETEERSELAEQAHAEAAAASVMTQVDRMADLIREVNGGRLAAASDRLTAHGRLTGHDRTRLAADDAFGSLEQLLRTAELAGHDPEKVLTGGGDLSGVRRRHLTRPGHPPPHHHPARRAAHPRVRTGTADLIPHHLRTPDPAHDATADAAPRVDVGWTRRPQGTAPGSACAADTRRHDLGTQTAEQAPAWVVDVLGPVPDDADVIADRTGSTEPGGPPPTASSSATPTTPTPSVPHPARGGSSTG